MAEKDPGGGVCKLTFEVGDNVLSFTDRLIKPMPSTPYVGKTPLPTATPAENSDSIKPSVVFLTIISYKGHDGDSSPQIMCKEPTNRYALSRHTGPKEIFMSVDNREML
ncbi:hypothetical protein H9P43_000287 [Blastocladiella emersonii ATCC 22665]|nr:hypothetical protein H9P43_000287 [Blastocladiella emersonii ATCC 22665]